MVSLRTVPGPCQPIIRVVSVPALRVGGVGPHTTLCPCRAGTDTKPIVSYRVRVLFLVLCPVLPSDMAHLVIYKCLLVLAVAMEAVLLG